MELRCGVGGQPKLDLIRPRTRLLSSLVVIVAHPSTLGAKFLPPTLLIQILQIRSGQEPARALTPRTCNIIFLSCLSMGFPLPLLLRHLMSFHYPHLAKPLDPRDREAYASKDDHRGNRSIETVEKTHHLDL